MSHTSPFPDKGFALGAMTSKTQGNPSEKLIIYSSNQGRLKPALPANAEVAETGVFLVGVP
jgi:hypothetical protein